MGFRKRLLESPVVASFKDVYLEPSLSPVEPHQVKLDTQFSKNVRLRIPLSSSPMDTVTELDMSVAMALHGGIGVVHRNMPAEHQLEIVRRVKSHPTVPLRTVYVELGEPCGRVLEVMRGEGVRQLPLLNGSGKLLGYVVFHEVAERCRNPAEPVLEELARSLPVASLEGIEDAAKLVRQGQLDLVAVVGQGGEYLGSIGLREALEEYEPAVDEEGRLLVAAAVSPFDRNRALKLDRVADALVSDVAHFHNKNVMEAARRLSREISSDFVIGNVGSYQAVADAASLIEKIDGVRAGVGGGSICTTPLVAGSYSPTLWATASARDAVDELNLNAPVIADGGIRSPGDAVKALAVGASSVMLGYALAGTDEASAPLLRVGGSLYKPYRGMASRGAMERRYAADRYSRVSKRVEEGVEGLVPYRGPVSRVIREFVEALKAGLGYAGASSIPELWAKARLIRVTEPKDVGVKLRMREEA